MRPYETIVVLSNELGGEVDALVERFKSLIQANGGTLDATHDWGNRRLAYLIRKQADGRYFLFEYSADADLVRELERNLRITDGVLRYITVQQEHTGLPVDRRRESAERDSVPLNELRSTPDRAAGRPPQSAPPEPAAPAPEQETKAPESAAATPAQVTPAAPSGAAAGGTDQSEGVKSDE